MNPKRLILAIGALIICVVGFGFIGYQFYSRSVSQYFAEFHIGESEDPATVAVYIVFDRDVAQDSPVGLAHYTEHLVALNSFAEDISLSDRHTSAYTNSYTVGYWKKGPKKDLVNILKKLSGVFEPLSLDAKFAMEEADIVLREYDLRMANSVDNQSHTATTAFLYQGNANALLALGTQNDIASLNYKMAKAYHKATHQRSAAVLLVLGDVSEREVVSAIESVGISQLTTLPTTPLQTAPFKLLEPETKQFNYDNPDVEPRITIRKVVALEQPVNFDLLDFQAQQLTAILETNLPGGLAGPLRYDKFIARGFEVAVYPIDEQHIEMWFDATPDAGVSFQQLQLSFEAALESAETRISSSTFDRVQKRLVERWPDWEDNEKTAQWMAGYAHSRVTMRRKPVDSNELKKLSSQMKLADTNRLLEALQKPGRKSVVYIGNNRTDKGDGQ